MRVTRDTKLSAIVNVLKVQFFETISDKIAQLYKQHLLKSDLTAQHESFKLIPTYERQLQTHLRMSILIFRLIRVQVSIIVFQVLFYLLI